MFNPTRDQARLFFIESWRKHHAREPLTDMESVAAELIAQHPEYHALLENPEAVHKDFRPEDGQINPFLHLSLHLAIHEQLSINQPAGLRDAYDACLAHHAGNRHAALHDMLEALGETLFNSQRNGQPPDAQAYVENVMRRAGRP
ncbi:MAG: hypothetical protein CGU29_05480 [Candidatus Dactylopiibacterium carminicum]|uniref:DUF1841 domain-containing protein n=1 Tax=Candidatus Dactylopiibacterium carminicum TaxID=857335 RepID=A0A272EVG3_9RHOO|nr:DUF1841 family protein [Candidatus Dactylopiibacterium carminicum]KAF7600078.1 DUF1841 domain-containing protein [Candidatus Dactylopiibacterium carminicum]PAS94092.1 MAG: hypothetical protein CGU29_05480 [Candidatus Dactylopiibacterium carminicum]PAT00083.1 MAG: hypothetical protein BSR46_04105 [Candidatus Dactylopiibacterium carminicum]